jgi:GH15 family glucan-1,4-alpha-glucosidase
LPTGRDSNNAPRLDGSAGGSGVCVIAAVPVQRKEAVKMRDAFMSYAAGLLAAGALAGSATAQVVWPGAGAGQPSPAAGYPPVSFWKEEGVSGNNFINSMLDQNGTWFDIYYPGAGGVQGVSTKAEGYVNGLDTFPAGLGLDRRGQMHLNQMMMGIRVDGLTHWTSNPGGVSFTDVQQAYVGDTQTIRSTSRLTGGGNNIEVEQIDFSPKGITFPSNGNKGILIKRMILTNRGPTKNAQVYLYMDPAINGGDNYDAMFFDTTSGVDAMVAFDNTFRVVTGTGCCFPGSDEYNPTTFSGYTKNVSIYLGAQLKTLTSVGGASGSTDSVSWRDLGSSDNSQGWIGQQVTLPTDVPVEVNAIIVGGFDPFAGASGTYNVQIRPVLQWFQGESAAALQTATENYWQNFLAQGVSVTTPDPRINTLFKRGILTTMLHFDEAKGGLIAGFRNGAYPYVWPRDMAWAGVTLARVGHTDTVRSMTRFLRDITYRDFETWTPGNTPGFAAAGGTPFHGTRKGFWKQKYTTDGFTVWGAPQVDETAVFPWMVKYLYDVTGDLSYLQEAEAGNPANSTYAVVKDAAIAMSQTSVNDGTRLNHRAAYPGSGAFLMYSNNIWEDQYDTFIYSNANIVRGLRDAASIATTLGQTADAIDFTSRASGILAGLNAKLDWNRENTDVSLLGIVYPFETHSPVDPRAVRVIDRINGVAADGNGAFEPLVRFAGQYNNDASDYVDLIDRYWGDSYWGNSALGPTPAGPWFLSTLWYGVYYAYRADFTPGKSDIDNHYYRINRTADHNGPIGLGAEQMAPINSLLYPGQTDFTLQTAWPNAWESMSFYVDAIMQFIDYRPDAPANTLRIAPKLPTAWNTMTFGNLVVGSRRIDVTVSETPGAQAQQTQAFTNRTGGAVNVATAAKIPVGSSPCSVTAGGSPVAYSHNRATGVVSLSAFPLDAAAASTTTLVVRYRAGRSADWNSNGVINIDDIFIFLNSWFAADGDFSDSNGTNIDDIFIFLNAWFTACP